RIEASAASISTMAPALRPRDSWWPIPTTLGRPPSPRRAMKQHTFVVPTSRTAKRSPPVLSLALRMMRSTPFPLIRLGVVAGLALQLGRRPQPNHEPIRQAHVDASDVPAEQALLAVQPCQKRPG